MAWIIDWHPAAIDEFAKIGRPEQLRIKKMLDGLAMLDDAKKRLLPYTSTLKGFWKLRVGDYRLICEIRDRAGTSVLIILVAHRSVAYGARIVRIVQERRS